MNRLPYILRAPEGGEGPGGGGGGDGGRSLLPPPPAGGDGSPPPAGGDGKGAVGEVWWKGWVREDGSLDQSRLKHLPEDRREDLGILSRFKSLDDLAKSLAHGWRTAKEKGLLPLREGATEAERAEHMAHL